MIVEQVETPAESLERKNLEFAANQLRNIARKSNQPVNTPIKYDPVEQNFDL